MGSKVVMKKARNAVSGMFYSWIGENPDPLLSTMALWTKHFDRNGILRFHRYAPDLVSGACSVCMDFLNIGVTATDREPQTCHA